MNLNLNPLLEENQKQDSNQGYSSKVEIPLSGVNQVSINIRSMNIPISSDNPNNIQFSFSNTLEHQFPRISFENNSNGLSQLDRSSLLQISQNSNNITVVHQNQPEPVNLKWDSTQLREALKVIAKEEKLTFAHLAFDEISSRLLLEIVSKKINKKEIRPMLKKMLYEQDKDALCTFNYVVITRKSKKRAEEKYKFVFKMTLNHFRERFFENNNLKKKDKISEEKFWKHYFGNFCEQRNIPINHVYDPLNNSLIKNEEFKCLNKSYLKLIFKNDKFKTMFFTYIKNFMADEYFEKIDHKFKKILEKLEKELNSDNRDIETNNNGFSEEDWTNKKIEEFIKKSVNTRGCKLPWSKREINHAADYFINYIGKLIREDSYKGENRNIKGCDLSSKRRRSQGGQGLL